VIQLLLRMTLAHGGDKGMVEALRSIMRPARLDRGCIWAQILRDVDLPDLIGYVEEWSKPEDLQERIRSDPFSQLLALMEAAPSAPSLEFRVVTEAHGLESLAAARDVTSIHAKG
jgi:quinol monooxygenase YgiN